MEEMTEIIRLHYPEVPAPLMDSALAIFYHLRQQGFEKPPATAELLDWLGALQLHDAKPPITPDRIPFLGTLLKRTQDLLQHKGVERLPRHEPQRHLAGRVFPGRIGSGVERENV